jgi:hypothetical protein
MKKRPFGKGVRRSGGKDLERQPLTVLIQGRQPYENIRFQTNARFLYLKDPYSKSLEPDCLIPQSVNYDTVSEGEGNQYVPPPSSLPAGRQGGGREGDGVIQSPPFFRIGDTFFEYNETHLQEAPPHR